MLRSAVGMAHVLRSRLVMNYMYTTSYLDYTQKSAISTLALKLSVSSPYYPWVTVTFHNTKVTCYQVLTCKYACMLGGPHVEICPFAIKFLGTYVIVMGVSIKLAYGPVHVRCGYIKITSKAEKNVGFPVTEAKNLESVGRDFFFNIELQM